MVGHSKDLLKKSLAEAKANTDKMLAGMTVTSSSDADLRRAVIKLAKEVPSMQKYLVPILRKTA
jgi:hypothetical protein